MENPLEGLLAQMDRLVAKVDWDKIASDLIKQVVETDPPVISLEMSKKGVMAVAVAFDEGECYVPLVPAIDFMRRDWAGEKISPQELAGAEVALDALTKLVEAWRAQPVDMGGLSC